MSNNNIDQIKKLRQETGVGVMDARKALESSSGNISKAREWLKRHAVLKAAKKADRQTSEGTIFSYIHQTAKVAAMVKIGCETDFVAKTDDFKSLGKEISMQVCSMNPKDPQELLAQEWIRDPKKTIADLVNANIAKVGENIKILEFVRMEI